MIENIVDYDSFQYKSSYYNLLFELKFLNFLYFNINWIAWETVTLKNKCVWYLLYNELAFKVCTCTPELFIFID